MATVPDSLLDDLDELGSDGDGPLEEEAEVDEAPALPLAGVKRARTEAGGVTTADLDALSDDEDDDDALRAAASAAQLELPADAELESQLSKLRGRTGFRSVAHLRETARFREHMARVAASTAAGALSGAAVAGHLEDHPDYRLVVASNQARARPQEYVRPRGAHDMPPRPRPPAQVIAALEDELAALHRYIADAYAPKFPELANLVPAPAEYVRVCLAVQVRSTMGGRGVSLAGRPTAAPARGGVWGERRPLDPPTGPCPPTAERDGPDAGRAGRHPPLRAGAPRARGCTGRAYGVGLTHPCPRPLARSCL